MGSAGETSEMQRIFNPKVDRNRGLEATWGLMCAETPVLPYTDM